MTDLAQEPASGLTVLPDSFTAVHRDNIVSLAETAYRRFTRFCISLQPEGSLRMALILSNLRVWQQHTWTGFCVAQIRGTVG